MQQQMSEDEFKNHYSKYNLKIPGYTQRVIDKYSVIRTWEWEPPNKTEDAEFEIIQPKQLENGGQDNKTRE